MLRGLAAGVARSFDGAFAGLQELDTDVTVSDGGDVQDGPFNIAVAVTGQLDVMGSAA